MRGALFILLLMSMSETFSVPFLTLIKLSYTEPLAWSSLVPGPEAKSCSEITNPTSFTVSYHCLLHLLHWQLDYLPLIQQESIYIYVFFFFSWLHQVLLIAEEGGDLPHPSCCLFAVVLRLLSSCSIWAPEHTGPVAVVCGLSCPAACGIPTSFPGLESMSPGLEGRFSTTGPQGKSLTGSFWCRTQLYLPSFCRKWDLLCMLSRKLSLVSHVAFY